MNTLSGITFEKDEETRKRYVRIDLEQYGEEMTPFLEKVGAINPNDDFERAWASAITGDELKKRMYQRIDAWPWKEK
jgi:hypothetical protein